MKKISIISLIVIILCTMLTSTVCADTLVQSTEFAMFDLYKGLRRLDSVESINPEEMFVWGFFLSNYLEPFGDGRDKGYNIFLEKKKNYLYYGQPDYTESLEKLFKRVVQFQFLNKKNVFVGDTDQIATFNDLISPDNKTLMVDASGIKLIVFKGNNSSSNLGLLLALAKGRDKLEQETYENIKDKTLRIDAFGNLLLDDDRVVIPAVLNPYIVSPNGEKFLFVNDYMLANYAHDVASPDSIVSPVYALPLEQALKYGRDKFKSPYNKYLFFNYNLYDNAMISEGFKTLSNYSELGMADNAKFTFKTFSDDYGFPAFSTLYTDSVSKQNLTISVCNDYRQLKSEVFKDLGFVGTDEELKTLFENVHDMLESIENADNSQVALKVFLKQSAVQVDEFEKSHIFGLFTSQTDLGIAINEKIDSINNFGLTIDINNFMSKMAMPERSSTTELFGDSYDSTQYGINLLRDLADYDRIKDFTEKDDFLSKETKYNVASQLVKNIAYEHIYKIHTLNESELFSTFTTSNGNLNTLGDNFITSMYYTYLKLYFGNLEGYNGWAGFNTQLVSEFLMMADYSSLISQLLTENYMLQEENTTQEELINNIRGLLDPNDASYRVNYINSTANEWLVSTHYKLTNSYEDDATASNTKETGYSGLSNFITTPTLKETPVIQNILNNYLIWYIVLFSIFFVSGIILFAIGAKTSKEVLIFFGLMAVFLLLPPYLIDNTVNLSNNFSETLFSKKLGNWALTQHQQYLLDLNTSGSDFANSMQMIKGAKSKEGVLLKWSSPKKINPYNDLYSMENMIGDNIDLNIFKWISQGFLQQEFYIDNVSYYLYRSMYDVAKSSKDAYDNFNTVNDRVIKINNDSGTSVFSHLDLAQERQMMLTAGKYSYFPVFANTRHYNGLYVYKGDSAQDKDTFNPLGNPLDIDLTVLDTKNYTLNGSRNPNEMFLTGSESVYFYFYNVIRDYMSNTPSTALENSVDIGTGFSAMLLSDDIFKVTNSNSPAYGEIKDFLDMENLFKNVIPYYKAFNRLAYSKIKSDIDMSDEDKFRYWAYYSIWVSALERTEYGKNDNISTIGKNIKIGDSFDHTQYLEYRPMLFSKAQQEELGYNTVMLSIVESKIQAILEKTYIDWRYLINDVGFSDESLIVMAALQATYNFNNEFSRTFLFKENASLNPKGYDLRGFSYDTIMKMLLMTSTGESLFGDKDIYERVIGKSSWVSGGLLVASDFIAVAIVSNIRYIYIILIFIMAYVLLFLYSVKSMAGNTEGVVAVMMKSLVLPVVVYLIASFAHSIIISALIGDSYNNLVGTRNTIVLSSPTSLFLWFIVINIIYTLVLLSTLIYLLKDFKGAIFALGGALWSLASTTAGYVGTKIINAGKSAGRMAGKAASYGMAGVTGEVKRRLGMDWAVSNTELMRMDRQSRKLEQRVKDELRDGYGYDVDEKKKKKKDEEYSDNISESVEQMKQDHTKQLPENNKPQQDDTNNKNMKALQEKLKEIEKKRQYVKDEVKVRIGRGE